MVVTLKNYSLKTIDYIALALISSTVIGAYAFADILFIEKLFHLIPGFLAVFFFLKFLISTPLAKKNFDKITITMFWFCLFYYIAYISFSSSYTKETDITGHMGYISFFYRGVFPDPDAGWQTYHPPLFHLIAAPFLAIGKAIDLIQPFDMVRYFCLMSYMVFLYYSVLLFKLVLVRKEYVYMAFGLLIVWPIGVIFSAKINNDILIYSTVMAGLYYFTNWYKHNNKIHFWYALNIALLALTVKNTGLFFCFALAICFLVKMIRKEATLNSILRVKRVMILFTLMLGLIVIYTNFGRTLYYNLSQAETKNFLAGNLKKVDETNWSAAYIKDDNINYYTKLNMEEYFREPYIMLFNGDYVERKYFWNTFIKSSILGVGRYHYPTFAKIINISYLYLLAYMLLSYIAILITNRSYILKSFTPLIILPAIGLSGMIYMRSIFHLTGYGQSRFIHYAMPILIIFLFRAIDYHKREGHKILYHFGMRLTFALGLMFFVFLIAQFRFG